MSALWRPEVDIGVFIFTGFHLILLRPGLSSNLEPTNWLDWLACDPLRPFRLGAHSAEITGVHH